jgi:hypothetical protein
MKRYRWLMAALLLTGFQGIAQVPVNGLVGYWPLDKDAKDYSGNGNHGVIYGAQSARDRFNQPWHAFRFDGSNARIVIPTSATVDMSDTTDFTVAFWMKVYPNNANGLPVCKQVWGSWNGYAFFTDNFDPGYCTASRHLSFYVAAGSQGDACSDSSYCQDTSWNFITGIYSYATNQTWLYVNGILQGDVGAASGSRSNGQPLVFGCHSNCTDDFFSGVLDGVRIYKRALSLAEIQSLYQESPSLGTADNENETMLSVFPNPCAPGEKLQVCVEPQASVQLVITDLYGRVLKTVEPVQSTATIDLDGFSEGNYLVRLMTPAGEVVRKVVIAQ